jgi:predicted outer membrane protein
MLAVSCIGLAAGLMSSAGARPAAAARATGTDQEIVMELHHDLENGVGIGQLAERRAVTPGVRALGVRLVRDQAAADERLRAYAEAHGVDPVRIATPYDALPHGALRHPELQHLEGSELDWQLAAAVVADQQAYIDRARVSAGMTNDAGLKALIIAELPMLEADLAEARAQAPKLTIPPPAPTTTAAPPSLWKIEPITLPGAQ